MNKTIKAWLKGYTEFRVNGEVFLTYGSANKSADSILGNVEFVGLHFWRGWERFFVRDHNPHIGS